MTLPTVADKSRKPEGNSIHHLLVPFIFFYTKIF